MLKESCLDSYGSRPLWLAWTAPYRWICWSQFQFSSCSQAFGEARWWIYELGTLFDEDIRITTPKIGNSFWGVKNWANFGLNSSFFRQIFKNLSNIAARSLSSFSSSSPFLDGIRNLTKILNFTSFWLAFLGSLSQGISSTSTEKTI